MRGSLKIYADMHPQRRNFWMVLCWTEKSDLIYSNQSSHHFVFSLQKRYWLEDESSRFVSWIQEIVSVTGTYLRHKHGTKTTLEPPAFDLMPEKLRTLSFLCAEKWLTKRPTNSPRHRTPHPKFSSEESEKGRQWKSVRAKNEPLGVYGVICWCH